MTTVIERKTPVEAKWNPKQIQEITAKIFARNCMVSHAVIAKFGPDAVKELDKQLLAGRVEHYKKLGVKTPIDLVKAIAEVETNVFGSKIQILGDEKKASLVYDDCAIWKNMKEIGQLTPKQEEEMGTQFEQGMQNLAREFGFKSELKFEDPCATVTFSK
jgi:hypothetical protein